MKACAQDTGELCPEGEEAGGTHPQTRGINASELPSCLAYGPSTAQGPENTLGREMQKAMGVCGDPAVGWGWCWGPDADGVCCVICRLCENVSGTKQALEDCVRLLPSQQSSSRNFSLQPWASRGVASSPASGLGCW